MSPAPGPRAPGPLAAAPTHHAGGSDDAPWPCVREPRLPAGVAPGGQCAGARRRPPPSPAGPTPGGSHRRRGPTPRKGETAAAREVGPTSCRSPGVRARRGRAGAVGSRGSWLPPRRTRRAGGGRSGGSWTRGAASAASAWAATWSSGASSRRGSASPCTRSSPSSCWTGTLLKAVCSVQVPNLHPRKVCSIWCFCLIHTAENAAWCLGSGGLEAKMGGLCGSAQQATPSPGAPLQVLHLWRSPSQPRFQLLPGEAGAQKPGAGRSLQSFPTAADLRARLSSSRQPGVSSPLTPPVPTGVESEHDEQTQQARLPRGVGPPPETLLAPGEGEEEDEDGEEMLSDASPWTYSSSPDDEPDVPRPPLSSVPHSLKEGESPPVPTTAPTALAALPSAAATLGSGASLPAEVGVKLELSGTSQTAPQTEPLPSPGSQAQSALASAWDEDTAQIGPKRIRKAAKRELLPCDFPGCGRIFSNRQYLNHHKKYQHIHQKSFSCPEPACGKSFNFKKHLKEHVKLHSDTRDYICEFCARSFRTSSNLVIHRRIHTGEKPLQCEICGFTCRQKASLNWHRRKHAETAATLRFPCEFCGKRFEKLDSVAAHCSKSHPALLPTQESPGALEPCAGISDPVPRPSLVVRLQHCSFSSEHSQGLGEPDPKN